MVWLGVFRIAFAPAAGMSALTLMKSPSSVVSKITPLTVPSASGTAPRGWSTGRMAEVVAGLHFQLRAAALGRLEATEGEAEVGAVAVARGSLLRALSDGLAAPNNQARPF